MKLEIGTVLEPRYDRNVEHAIVLNKGIAHSGNTGIIGKQVYLIQTLKSKNRAVITEDELNAYYEVIGQTEVGRALFCDTDQQMDCGNDCVDCKCTDKLGDKL